MWQDVSTRLCSEQVLQNLPPMASRELNDCMIKSPKEKAHPLLPSLAEFADLGYPAVENGPQAPLQPMKLQPRLHPTHVHELGH